MLLGTCRERGQRGTHEPALLVQVRLAESRHPPTRPGEAGLVEQAGQPFATARPDVAGARPGGGNRDVSTVAVAVPGRGQRLRSGPTSNPGPEPVDRAGRGQA